MPFAAFPAGFHKSKAMGEGRFPSRLHDSLNNYSDFLNNRIPKMVVKSSISHFIIVLKTFWKF